MRPKSGIITLTVLFLTVFCMVPDTVLAAGAGKLTIAGFYKWVGSAGGKESGSVPFPAADKQWDTSGGARLREKTDSLAAFLEERDYCADPERLAAEITALLEATETKDLLLLSDAYYFVGVHLYQSNLYIKASDCFSRSVTYREKLGLADRRYANGLINMAVSLLRSGDFSRAYPLGIKALEAKRALLGSDSSGLATNYLNLASICLELNDNEQAVTLAEAGLTVSGIYPDLVPPRVRADLYHVIGLSLYRTQEYNKSLVYCREALKIFESDPAGNAGSRILLHNTIALVYRRLGQSDKAEEYFRRGLVIKEEKNAEDKEFLYINYSNLLGQSGQISEGERVLEEGLARVKSIYGPESREYFMMLVSYADFINSNHGGSARSLALYEQCFSYVRANPWDVSASKFLTLKYVQSLAGIGKYAEVLRITDETDFLTGAYSPSAGAEAGSGSNLVAPAVFSENDIGILEIRYAALNALANDAHDGQYDKQAVETGKMIVSLYDRQRLELSEDESRTSFSAYSRDIYTGIIGNYARLYEADHSREALEGIFEYSERSKVAGFLASIRELNAARFSLPAELAGLEADIRRQTGFYRELIASEQLKAVPDSQRLATWESVTFSLLRSRDSLNRIFKEQYPSYYNLKYRNEVASTADVGRVIGRRSNLLSYVLTSDRLYIFVANRRGNEVITREIDSGFFDALHRFRRILSTSPMTTGSRARFNEYMDLAYSLYRILIEPAEPYLVGDKIVISPDNILSYLPFETLVTEEFRSPELLYREAPFALKKYRFSYIYSVTLSSETMQRTRRLNNRLVAFAPTYEGLEVSDSVLAVWPTLSGEIRELPAALIEAEDAVSQCGGRAYLAGDASEETFKREAPGYDIIHLAMHALVDDSRPAFSKMLFAGMEEGPDDGMLNTYEVYRLPLKAMMVVLSSCNTGSGTLAGGEGILSLARGFLYAGSRSAVMSMWEVDDASASEVIHSFYKNMRSGQTKSSALRNARLKFLRSADQGRSHPYYWSTLVIYGDDTPLWYNRVTLYISLLLLLLVVTVLVALIYREPRS
jgi:CHAT domain-containing protein